MRHWSLTEAKARFSNVVDSSLHEGPQIITRRRRETAVLVSVEEWRRFTNGANTSLHEQGRHRSLKELLLADEPRFDLDLPPRDYFGLRPPPDFDRSARLLTHRARIHPHAISGFSPSAVRSITSRSANDELIFVTCGIADSHCLWMRS
jgi:antitoxin Phd